MYGVVDNLVEAKQIRRGSRSNVDRGKGKTCVERHASGPRWGEVVPRGEVAGNVDRVEDAVTGANGSLVVLKRVPGDADTGI